MGVALVQGWTRPPRSVKYHYFIEGQPTCLCRRWEAAGLGSEEFYDQNHGCDDNCAACQRKRIELQQNG